MARKITNGLHYFTLGFHFNIRIHYIMPIVGNTLIVIINKTTSGKGYYSEAKWGRDGWNVVEEAYALIFTPKKKRH